MTEGRPATSDDGPRRVVGGYPSGSKTAAEMLPPPASVSRHKHDEDDFTHYFNATSRLTQENARLRTELAALRARIEALAAHYGSTDVPIIIRRYVVADLRAVLARPPEATDE